MRSAFLLAFAACATLLATADVAHAWSDGGRPNPCVSGSGTWWECSVHSDCGAGSCHEAGFCTAEECRYGETCTDSGCQCQSAEPPTPDPGCEAVQDVCADYRIVCPSDAGPSSAPDAGIPDALDGGAGPKMHTAGCAVSPSRGGRLAPLALFGLAFLAWRRRFVVRARRA